MTQVVFDIAAFRLQFPAFASVTKFPDVMLEMYYDMATCYVNDDTRCTIWKIHCLTLALYLMTAHLTALSVLIAGGQVPGLVESATIDKVTVSLTPPKLLNQWQWWLSLTPYGQQLLALLQQKSAGGFYIGGLPEGTAIRKWGGIF